MLLLGMIRVQVVSFRMIILKKRNLPFAHNCSSTASDDVPGYSSLSTIECQDIEQESRHSNVSGSAGPVDVHEHSIFDMQSASCP